MKKETKQKLPSWFTGELYEESGIVRNRFSGEECELNNIELSMYDYVMGATLCIEMGIFNSEHHIVQLRKGLDWFKENNAEAYMILLD
jgi:hypothetical protein